jgi:hypothetical protein
LGSVARITDMQIHNRKLGAPNRANFSIVGQPTEGQSRRNTYGEHEKRVCQGEDSRLIDWEYRQHPDRVRVQLVSTLSEGRDSSRAVSEVTAAPWPSLAISLALRAKRCSTNFHGTLYAGQNN